MAERPASQNKPPEAFTEESLIALVVRETGVQASEARAMIQSVKRGEDQAEYFGLTPDVQASLENCAIAYYHGKRYGEALQGFQALLVLTAGQRPTAWRGAGACYQALHAYQEAVNCYLEALARNPEDTLSAAHGGECLCLLGMRQEGLDLLAALVENAPASEAKSPHMLRAKALLAAGGGPGTPSPVARKHAQGGQAASAAAKASASHEAARKAAASASPTDADDGVDSAQASAQADVDAADEAARVTDPAQIAELLEQEAQAIIDSLDDDDGDDDGAGDYLQFGEVPAELEAADPHIRTMMREPETRDSLQKIAAAVLNKELSIRILADFSDEQMDAGYAVACQYLERNEVTQAMQVCQQMIWLDGKDTRFYQLAGLCAHRNSLFCLADYYYELVNIWRPGGADAATLIYQGEAKMLTKEVGAGLELVRRGMALGRADSKMAPLIHRGEALLQQGEMMRKNEAEAAEGAMP